MHDNSWREEGTATNGVATATRAVQSNGAHVVDYVSVSFSAAAIALLTVTLTINGSAVTVRHYVHNADQIALGLKGDEGTTIVATLAAGGNGIVGFVTTVGHTL